VVDKDVDEVTDMFKGLAKKKKSSSSSKKPKDGDAPTATDDAVTADGEFDPSTLKKKKQKKTTKTADVEDFDTKLAEAGVTEGVEAEEPVPADEQGGDPEKGRLWPHKALQAGERASLTVTRHRSLATQLDNANTIFITPQSVF
jgi:translation initiation factor 2 subunit 2